MRTVYYLAIITLCVFIYKAANAEETLTNQTHLLPADEAGRDLSFVEFRDKMLQAVRQKEPELLVNLIDQNVWVDRKKNKGMKKFAKAWRIDAIDSEIWSELEAILTNGGGFVRSERGVEFCAPYIFTHFPTELDGFEYGAIVKKDVSLKPQPSISSKNISKLSYDLVKVHDWRTVNDANGEDTSWIKVTTLSGLNGFVKKEYVRSPTDYSACFLFTRKKGWKMTSLLANN